MDKYSKYVENNLRQANLLSHMIVPLGKLGKRKAKDRRVLLGKSAKKPIADAGASGESPDKTKSPLAKDQDKGPEEESPGNSDQQLQDHNTNNE